MDENISKIIRAKREEMKLTQKQLADKTGLNANTIYNAEKAKATCTLDTYRKICAVLGLSIEIIRDN